MTPPLAEFDSPAQRAEWMLARRPKTDLLFAALGCFALAGACLAILIALNRK